MNKDRSLASLDRSEKVTEDVRSAMIDPSFGNVVFQFQKKHSRMVVVESGEGYDFEDKFRSYRVIEENEDFFLVEAYDILFEKNMIQKLHRKDNCFFEYFEKWDYSEYYCKADGKSL